MKTLQLTLLLACSTLVAVNEASAVVIFNDNMESYTTANATSILDLANNASRTRSSGRITICPVQGALRAPLVSLASLAPVQPY